MKAIGGGGIAPLLTTALDRGEWSASLQRLLYPQGKSARYPLDKRLSGPQSRSGHCGEEKNLLPPPGNRTPVILPLAHRYTDWVIRAPSERNCKTNLVICS
jgi:hypothetical protein